MFNLSEKFKEIADKYRVIDYCYDLPEYLYDKYEEELLNVYNAIDENTPIAFYGLGLSALETFKILKNAPTKNIVCLIDMNPYYKEFCNDYDYLNIPIISPDEIKNYKIEKILVTPYGAEKEILEYLHCNYPNIEPISIYKNLAFKGYMYTQVFNFFRQDNTNFYVFFKDMLCRLKCSKAKEEKRPVLKRLISMCLKYKDFVSAKIFLDQYVDFNYDDSKRYSEFWKELDNLFYSMKIAVKNRKFKNINIFILDCLTTEFAENINVLMDLSKKGLYFKNAYSMAGFTTSSISGFLSGKSFYQDGGYLLDQDIMHTHSYFNELRKNFRVSSNSWRVGTSVITRKYNDECQYNISLAYWDYLVDYLNNDCDSIYITHSIYESHPHYYNAKISDAKFCGKASYEYDNIEGIFNSTKKNILNFSLEDYLNQERDAANYINEQLGFYTDFFVNENDTFVFMGDHGVVAEESYNIINGIPEPNLGYLKKRYNPFLLVLNHNIAPRVIDKMFSYRDFGKLIFNINYGDFDLSCYERDYVICDSPPLYYKPFLQLCQRLQMYDTIEGGIIVLTNTEKYIKYISGREELYLLPHENKETNLINNKDFSQRIEFFRSLVEHIDLKSVHRVPKYAEYLKYLPH